MLAESFGAKGVKIENASEFQPRLREALDAGGVWIFDVRVDYSENIKLTEKLKESFCDT